MTLFDYFWWLNFSLKWQQVTLRLPALRDDAPQIYDSLRHFFRSGRFQQWSLAHPEIRLPATWVEYNATGSPRTTPWGDVAFKVGWKPISFSDSRWRLVVDGTDTGLVVAVGH